MTVSVLYVSTSRGEGEKNVLDGYRERVWAGMEKCVARCNTYGSDDLM